MSLGGVPLVAVIRAFLRKERLDLGRRKLVLSIYVGMPLFFALMPIGFAIGIRHAIASGETDDLQDLLPLLERAIEAVPRLAMLPLGDAAALFLLRQTSLVLLLVPVVLTTFAGAYSIIGERTERTIEPLLATPLSDGQILLGKVAALGIPAYLATVAGASIAAVVADLALGPALGRVPLPDATWLVTILVLCPLMTVLGLLVSVWISARSIDVQSAQQLAGLLALPVVLMLVPAVARPALFARFGLAVLAAVLLLADVLLFRIVRSRFEREAILTRWR